jgi:hypothetical protein
MKMITIMVIIVKLGARAGAAAAGERAAGAPVSGPRGTRRAGTVYLNGFRTQAVNIL